MLRNRSAEDALMSRLVGKGSHSGSVPFSRAGDIIQRPPTWAAIAGLLAVTGRRGRRAALRGSVCYLSAALAHLPIKALVGRRHPPGAALHQLGPVTSSFPSGHAASDLAFVFGAAQELPPAFVPLSAATMAVHWSLVRKRAHYLSDVLAGGALGIVVSLVVRKVWPPTPGARDGDERDDRVGQPSTGDDSASGAPAVGERALNGSRPEAPLVPAPAP